MGDPAAVAPEPESEAYWLTHHDLGLGRSRDGRTSTYRVEHPVWELHPVALLKVDVHFAALYGEAWGYLRTAEPPHIALARGSKVGVSPAGTGRSTKLQQLTMTRSGTARESA